MSLTVKCVYVYGVFMCVRVFWSVQALYGAANALCWKCLKNFGSVRRKLQSTVSLDHPVAMDFQWILVQKTIASNGFSMVFGHQNHW